MQWGNDEIIGGGYTVSSRDIEKIEKIQSDRKAANEFYSQNSEVYRSFVSMERKTYSNGELEKRYKEMIAIGISIIINCESCLE